MGSAFAIFTIQIIIHTIKEVKMTDDVHNLINEYNESRTKLFEHLSIR